MRSSLLRILLSVPLTFSTINVANTETRRLQFKIEPIIILNCIEQVNYTINTNQLASAGRTRRSDAPRAIVTQSARQINANFAVDQVVDEPNSAIVEVAIPNACSLRGLGRGEGFLVDVNAVDQGFLTSPNTLGALRVKDARGKPHYSASYSNRFSIPQERIRLDREIQLDVQLLVDIRFATGSGEYSSPVDGVFSIEVSAP